MAMLEVNDIKVYYGMIQAIKGVSFHVDEGEVIALIGANGAGKTTASYTVLPEMLDCREFVNADEIAKGLSPFNPESVAIDAGRLMLQRMDDLLLSLIHI